MSSRRITVTSILARLRGGWRQFERLAPAAQSPLSLLCMLALRSPERRARFRTGRLILHARRSDLTAVSEVAVDNEYAFVNDLIPPVDALVVDLGANIGCFAAAVFSICPGAEVHSVEPSPDTFALLLDNRRRYPGLRWHVHRLAIAHACGIMPFRNEGPSTARSLAAAGTGQSVLAEAFDAFFARIARDRRIFLCKMDVEGAEGPIFAGTMSALSRIDHFVVEVHGSEENADRVRQRLAAAFPHLEAIARRGSSKPLIHAWRDIASGRVDTEDIRPTRMMAACQ
jgi:FkbM family methyltransferase